MIHKNLSLLSNNKLREDFLKTIKFVQSVWSLYFFTEFFLYDEIQKIVEKDKNFMNKVREIQKLKFNLRAVLNKTYFDRGSIFAKYLKEISQRTKVKNFDLFNYQEVADLLINRKPKLTGRKYFVLGKFNNWQPVFGREALKIINAFDRIISQEGKQREFKGQIANRGFYQGRVKIIPFDLKKDLAKDISQMKKGDILVTGSTGPEMILAFKKAGAIVTEEGGIASQAAIV